MSGFSVPQNIKINTSHFKSDIFSFILLDGCLRNQVNLYSSMNKVKKVSLGDIFMYAHKCSIEKSEHDLPIISL